MSLATRLQNVTQSLSPLQRVALLLQAEREGRRPDPELLRFAEPQQQTAFNRYVALLFAGNVALGAWCHTLHILCEGLESAAEQVRLLEQAAGVLEEEHGLKRPRRARDWRNADRLQVNEFLRSLAREQKEALARVLALRWQELRAVELAWDELALEFGGEDPVTPDLRQEAMDAAGRLKALAAEFGLASRLGEPSEETVVRAREAVDDAFRRLEPLL